MKKKAQPQGNAAHRQKRMHKPKPCKRCQAYEDSISQQSIDLTELEIKRRNEYSEMARRLSIAAEMIAVQRDDLQKSDAALQSYVSSFDALKQKLQTLAADSSNLTRSEVLVELKTLISS
jgi:hypothetical protein